MPVTQTKELNLYTPHDAQMRIHQSQARYRVASWGRQSGKSTWGVNELLDKAWRNPGTTYWFISPTYDQAKVQYRRTVSSLWHCPDVLLKKNQTEHRIKLINNSEIIFKSGEVLDNLRGSTLHGVIIDEMRDQHKDLWPMVVRPMLTTTGGWGAFISTPRGYDQFYDMAETAKADTTGQWAFFSAPSTCNPLFVQSEYEYLKTQMSEPQFDQEINANFRDITSGKVYINFSSANLTEQNPFAQPGDKLSPHLPIIVGMDFNVSPMAWSLGQERTGKFYWFDEIWIKDTNTQQCAEVLAEKVKGHKPGVILCGDATGNSRNTKASESDYAIIVNALRAHNIKWVNRVTSANPSVVDRINSVNAKLKDASGAIHLWVNPKTCPMLRRDFERVVWKESAQGFVLDQIKDRTLTHSSDGVGYAVYELSPIGPVNQPGRLRVILR